MSKNKKRGFFLSLSVFTVLLAVGVFFLNIGTSQGTTNSAAYKQSVQKAITELNLPTSNNANAISNGKNSLASFIEYRSGVVLTQSNKDLLSSKEQLSWNQSKRLSRTQLAAILTEIASDELRDLTDAERDNAVEALRGFNHPSLPPSFIGGREYVSLRANGRGHMTAAELTNQLDNMRGENVDTKLNQTLINIAINNEIDSVIGVLNDADPDFFGGTKGDMTPMQAVLVSYAVVTNDLLMGNQSDMNQMLLNDYAVLNQAAPGYPPPTGHTAYGLNGYKWSSPTDFLMDDASITKLINEIAQRSNL